ncbi:MAG: hypothetical protein ABI885_27635, partial [Gammaproteobacteria bacterium]
MLRRSLRRRLRHFYDGVHFIRVGCQRGADSGAKCGGVHHTAAEAGMVLVWANVGSLLGAFAIGFAAQRFRVVPLIVGAMFVAFLCVVAFGAGDWSLHQMAAIGAVAGVFVN